MTDRSHRLYDEFARLFTDATSVAQGVKREAETLVRSQAERFVGDMDLVRREDFDAVREMAARARTENERLAARIAVLEDKLGITPPPEPAPRAASSAARAKPVRKPPSGGGNTNRPDPAHGEGGDPFADGPTGGEAADGGPRAGSSGH